MGCKLKASCFPGSSHVMYSGNNSALTLVGTGRTISVEDIPQMTLKGSKELGKLVRKARKDKGLTVRSLADASDLDWSYIGRLERGEIGVPSPLKLQKLARALDLEIEDFYALAGYIMPEGLPGLAPYLRVKYDLPEAAGEEVERYVARLQKRLQAAAPPQSPKRGRP